MMTSDRRIALVLFTYAMLLAVLPVVLDEHTFAWTFSEEGPFERLSIVVWIATALIIVVRIRPFGGGLTKGKLKYVKPLELVVTA